MLIVEFMVTEKCNLECKYCYMANKQKFMTNESVDKFFESIDEILKMYNQTNYHISYFGGEPTLNWGVIEYSLPKFKADPRCHSLVMISNGLELNEKRVQFMKENNLGISLSFDGIWNNENRPYYKDHLSSFDKYIEKKELLKSLTNGCKVMVSPGNISTMTENFEFFVNEYGFLNPDFSLVRDDIWSKEDIILFDKEIKRLADKVIEYNKKGIQSTVGLFHLYILDILVGRKFGKRKFGCFAGINGVGYTPDNKYYPCARFASQYEFELFDANTMIMNTENVNELLQPKYTDPREFPECKECSLYRFCNAGCTYSQIKYGIDDKRAKPVDSVCSIMKLCYREALRVFEELKDTPYKMGIVSSLNNIG